MLSGPSVQAAWERWEEAQGLVDGIAQLTTGKSGRLLLRFSEELSGVGQRGLGGRPFDEAITVVQDEGHGDESLPPGLVSVVP
ncbi:hypothetical protein ACFWFU_04350 [Streptomyces sp. NPDC060235]|uniref:hypothetical protein n=1 Tax=Streptomyces sp. NPDC060235 TaxID=3347080 RepID=UPI0036586C07